MRNFNFFNRQSGLTLLELMFALALGLIVILSVTQSLVSMSNSSRVQMQQAELNDTANTALSYISFRMRNALSSPCERYARLDENNELTINTLKGTVAGEKITDTDSKKISNLIDGLGINVSGGDVDRDFGAGNTTYKTDNITILSTGDRLTPNEDVTFKTKAVTIDGFFVTPRVGNKTLYSITDCTKMDVFRATRTAATDKTTLTFANGAGTIKAAYRTADLSIISPLDIAEISLSDDGNLLDTTIFKKNGGGLINNIDLIRILFGIDVTGDGITDQYVTRAQLSGLASNTVIMSADIYMLVRNSSPVPSYSNNYTVSLPDTSAALTTALPAMQEITITDKIPRRVFMRSVVFRNSAITL